MFSRDQVPSLVMDPPFTRQSCRERRNLTTGLFAGKQEGGGTLVLSESGDEFTTDGYSIVYSVDGIPGTGGCANSVGTRFKLEP